MPPRVLGVHVHLRAERARAVELERAGRRHEKTTQSSPSAAAPHASAIVVAGRRPRDPALAL